MTVTRVPASNPEPEVPITDPRWLASTQPDPEPEVDERRGLDGPCSDVERVDHAADHYAMTGLDDYRCERAEEER